MNGGGERSAAGEPMGVPDAGEDAGEVAGEVAGVVCVDEMSPPSPSDSMAESSIRECFFLGFSRKIGRRETRREADVSDASEKSRVCEQLDRFDG